MQIIQQGPSRIGNAELLAGTISVVSAYLQTAVLPTEWVEDVIRDVHSAMVDVASDSKVAASNFDRTRFRKALETASARFGVDAGSLAPAAVAEPVQDRATSQFVLPLGPPSIAPSAAPAAAPVPNPRSKGNKVVDLVSARPSPALRKQASVPPSKEAKKALDAVRTSVRMNTIVCLEDNARVSDLAAHLFEKFDMSPEAYKTKWGLPDSYPMHAPANTLKRGDQFEIDPVTRSVVPLRG